MNCRDTETLLLAERDGVLNPEQHAALSAHVASCPVCRAVQAHLAEAGTFLQNEAATLALPDVETEWHTVRAQLQGASVKPGKKRPLAPVIWFSAPLAAAAALAVTFFATRPETPASTPMPPPSMEVAAATPSFIPEDIIGSDDSAPAIVYVDRESGWLVVWSAGEASEPRG